VSQGLFSRIHGCLLGGAIGDAMGGPVESLHYDVIRRDWGRVDQLLPYRTPGGGRPRVNGQRRVEAGAYTDDTLHALLISWTIARRNGRITAQDLAEIWFEHADIVLDLWYTEKISLYRWALAGVPAEEAGRDSVPADNAVIGIAPIGLINAGDPRQAAQDAYQVAGLMNDGPSRTGASTVASAVAAAMVPGATVQSVIQAAREHSEPPMREAIDRAVRLAEQCTGDVEFTERFYRDLLVEWPYAARMAQLGGRVVGPQNSWGVDVHEVVPAALGHFVLADGDPAATIVGCVNFGRDCDSIASIGGHIAGALRGVEVLPSSWKETIESANPFGLEPAARGIHQALEAERERTRALLNLLDSAS
jgi:ADP-ribosylglycohydrolase